jgi:hypothetical protein
VAALTGEVGVAYLLLLLVALGAGGLAWLLTRSGGTGRQQHRRTARTSPEQELDEMLRHVDAQMRLLLGERARLQALVQRGKALIYRMERSAQHRSRSQHLETVLDSLRDRGLRLDQLIGRYNQHKEDLAILREGERFRHELEAYEAGGTAADPFGAVLVETEALDEEAERLVGVAEAEDELDALLGL